MKPQPSGGEQAAEIASIMAPVPVNDQPKKVPLVRNAIPWSAGDPFPRTACPEKVTAPPKKEARF